MGAEAALTERERLALAYAGAAAKDANCIPEALFAEVREMFSDGEIVELTLLVGLTAMLNLFNSALEVRYHGEYGTEAGGEGDGRGEAVQ